MSCQDQSHPEDLENLVIAHVLNEQSRLGPEFIPEEIFVWNLRGEREILNSAEIEAVKLILKNAHSNYDSEFNVNGRMFREGAYGIFEVKGGKSVEIAKLIEPDPSDNCVRHMNISGNLLLIGDNVGRIFAFDTSIPNAKPYLFHCETSFNPVRHANLLSDQKLLVQYVGGTVLFDKASGEEYDLNNNEEITRSAEFKTPKTMKCLVLGTGNIACKKNTSLIIEAGKKYLVDVPPFLEQMLENNNQDISKINDIILTHIHPDHFNGLEQFLFKKISGKKKLNIYTTSKIYAQALSKLSPWIREQAKNNLLIFKELNSDQSYKENDIDICVRDNIHEEGVPTIGFKFSYKGKTLGYSSDCKYFGENKLEDMFEKISKLTKDGHLFEMCEEQIENPNFTPDETSYYPTDEYWENAFIKTGKSYVVSIEPLSDVTKKLGLTNFLPGNFNFSGIKKKFSDVDVDDGQLVSSTGYGYYLKDVEEAILTQARQRKDVLSMNWFYNCDLIIHEADDAENPVHTNVKELEGLPENIRSKLYITHLPPGFQERYTGPLKILQEGMRYRL
jgi:ribonuclease BN (tRNA processing enzyme)